MKAFNVEDVLSRFKINASSREFKLGVVLAGVAVIVAYMYFFIIPRMAAFLNYFGKAGQYRVDIRQVEDALTREEALKKKMLEMTGKVALYEKKLPSENEIPVLLEWISETAKSTGVKIMGINPSPAVKPVDLKEKKPFREIPVSVTARSGYHELGAFVNSLENGERFAKVSNIKIVSTPVSKKIHEIELSLNTYVLLKE